jgi:hypothetical protein
MTIAELVDQLAMYDPETQVFMEVHGGVVEPSIRWSRFDLDDDPDDSTIVHSVIFSRRKRI